MKTITVRGLDDDVAESLKETAGREGKSVNQLVVDIVRERLGLKKQRKFTAIHNDLDHLFGTWSEDEFRQIQGKIDLERKIDKELWQ